MERILLLEDGTYFSGQAFGALKEVSGELIFTTGMTGYQETITDPSYFGQLITFTYPMIGNYGITADNNESVAPSCKAVIVKEWARRPSNWRSQMNLDEFLKQYEIPGLAGIDTRALTHKIREQRAMKAAIIAVDADRDQALAELKAEPAVKDHVASVSTKTPYPNPNSGRRVVVVDFGLKHSILRALSERHCSVTVVPYDTDAQTILALKPDGVMLSNGPGDPKDLSTVLDMIREIQEQVPIFGICLGHQLFALANGADTYKMKFGHRGVNHPVREIATGRIDFTSQNHGYAVAKDSIDPEKLIITHVEINDGTVEGLKHRHYPAFTVQYHPDAAPGPHDALHLFDDFMAMIDARKEH
ncbi:carbamoyl phosphate synthase small subunit [Aerococcus sp. UMB7533]|uniref:carbamoyl phosphate synthase small subunit n=1 Tax=Aerococcus sp. UMB7533 TaxID=3046340 RepID=UPI00254B9437|nr:carbamoyl phosphate synthase small subunit [Aerococcus sp. UMB7533]MDK6855058.1 carbamoyl phosphate synthase small subunit [Aerococcus sp. UMB7533]